MNSITKLSDGRYKAFVMNSKAASILNHRFKLYIDADFEKEQSEGIFYFDKNDYQFVFRTLTKFGGFCGME